MKRLLLQIGLTVAVVVGYRLSLNYGEWWALLLGFPACFAIAQSVGRWIAPRPQRTAFENLVHELNKLKP